MKRSSGILMPLFSLPSPYGIGTLGKAAYDFIDFLKAAGQKYWQLLPLCPTDHGDSPYSSPSTFAGNPYFIDLDTLAEEGLLDGEELKKIDWGGDEEKVDYRKMYENRLPVLRKAFEKGREAYAQEIQSFYDANRRWLENYALYMALKKKFENRPWYEWPEDIRRREAQAVERYSCELKEETRFWVFVQFMFYRQWDRLKTYAAENGISFIGDVPIYVAMDSADVWSEPWFFMMDENFVPTEVSGVPPDYFNEDGQLWGNPIYDYAKMKADGYGWWIRRIEGAARLYDAVRIDHFRGFESFWAVPYGEKTARSGVWRKGPGIELVRILTSWFNQLEFIAEDLGINTPEVAEMLRESKLPGMKVLEFAFDSKSESSYLPHNCQSHSCCYIGTHDNNTVLGWLEEQSAEDLEFAADYMHITEEEGWCRGMIRTGMATGSNLFVMQMQDILELPGSCRTNMPGVAEGNWRWRMKKGAADSKTAAELLKITETYRRKY